MQGSAQSKDMFQVILMLQDLLARVLNVLHRSLQSSSSFRPEALQGNVSPLASRRPSTPSYFLGPSPRT